MLRKCDRGDTLIEVIFATAVLALIIVIALSIMNKGTLQTQRAVEGTFVRQEIDSQTEMLRFARDSYVNKDTGADTLWNSILAKRVGSVMSFDSIKTSGCVPSGAGPFYLQTTGTSLSVQTSFSAPVTYAAAGKGIWIEATPIAPNAGYVDFYLYACWDSPVGTDKATSGTIVRLYAPAP